MNGTPTLMNPFEFSQIVIVSEFRKTLNSRFPNRKDSDYFSAYENLNWSPTPWYNRISHSIYQILYFTTGPKFVVPILGIVIKTFKQNYVHTV